MWYLHAGDEKREKKKKKKNTKKEKRNKQGKNENQNSEVVQRSEKREFHKESGQWLQRMQVI